MVIKTNTGEFEKLVTQTISDMKRDTQRDFKVIVTAPSKKAVLYKLERKVVVHYTH